MIDTDTPRPLDKLDAVSWRPAFSQRRTGLILRKLGNGFYLVKVDGYAVRERLHKSVLTREER